MLKTLAILCLLLFGAKGPSEVLPYNVFGQLAINPYDNKGVDCSVYIRNMSGENIYFTVFDHEIFRTIHAGYLNKGKSIPLMCLSEHKLTVNFLDIRGVELSRVDFTTKQDRNHICEYP